MEGVRIIFILSLVFWIKKEGRAVKHNSEKQDMGVKGQSLSRYTRGVVDCSERDEIDGSEPVSTTPDGICNTLVKSWLCRFCDNNHPSKIRLKLTGTSEGNNLTYYANTSTGSVNRYSGCGIIITVGKEQETPRFNLSCRYFDDIPCEEELDSDDELPSCHLCFNGTLPRNLCPENPYGQTTTEKTAKDDKSPLIGGVIGCVVGVVIVIVAVVICLWYKRRQQRPATAESISNNMKYIVHEEKEDISDDESLPDPPQDAHQRQSVNQYESVTELGTPQFHKRNKKPTNDDYTYIHDRDLEWKNKIRKGQPAGVFPIDQNTKSNSLGGNENDGYNRLGDSQPLSTATTKSYSARKRDNQHGNTNDAYNHAGDSTDSVARDIYHRLDSANEDEDTYNHAEDSVDDPEVIDTYNHVGAGKNVIKESYTHNRGGDANLLSTDDYHRLGGVAQVGKTSACCSDRDDGQNDTDAYNRLGDTNEEVNESDTDNHCEGFKRIPKTNDTYNRLNGVGEDAQDPGTYNTTRGDIPVSKNKGNYHHIVIDGEVVKEKDKNAVNRDSEEDE